MSLSVGARGPGEAAWWPSVSLSVCLAVQAGRTCALGALPWHLECWLQEGLTGGPEGTEDESLRQERVPQRPSSVAPIDLREESLSSQAISTVSGPPAKSSVDGAEFRKSSTDD